jgi:hypothetical protein
MQHRICGALDPGLIDSVVKALAIVRKRKLVELLPQSEKLFVVRLGQGAQFFTALPLAAQEAEDEATPQRG